MGDQVTYHVYNFMRNNLHEEDDEIYSYHQDRLGSMSLITNQYSQVAVN